MLRSLQDWFIRYQLNWVPGVSEVASIGGFVLQYPIDVDPTPMRAYNMPGPDEFEAVQRSNSNVGVKVIEANNMECVVHTSAWPRFTEVLTTTRAFSPVLRRLAITTWVGGRPVAVFKK